MANALATLFTDIANSIRNKTGGTDKMSPSEFPSQIDSIQGGGGGVPAGYKTVTFMNGDSVLFERLVLNGDDCPDPLTQGRIETPTKESTPQYNYTYSGWSEALTNITEDKVIYATFTETIRTYTVTFYDEDGATVLHTEQVAYGSVPSYTPTKEGATFDKWTPTPTNVTGNASYVASWASAIASGTCSDSITWTLLPDYTLKIQGTGSMPNYSNSTSYESRPWDNYKDQIVRVDISEGITYISDYNFWKHTNLQNITIPDSVTSMGIAVFSYCSSLTSAVIPNGVTSIGMSAFSNCSSLTSVVIPNGVTSIGMSAFSKCSSLTSVAIPSGVTILPHNTFNTCSNLVSVVIPSSVADIQNFVFYQCLKLADVYYSGSETDKSNITIGTNNEPLTNATWHYNYTN